ncbi:hypothetical protein PROFUN_12605 [Planoprotostelium fungivorum]|uniref:Uncharacterized protein n=1 Tax=Planoprotostelium fungivorum TaxID=1890364 RepID=A0A2P6N699_9EUKA|nr:hypothetical protein PROFUN_12605 [Planoprotostelium fungivorum]
MTISPQYWPSGSVLEDVINRNEMIGKKISPFHSTPADFPSFSVAQTPASSEWFNRCYYQHSFFMIFFTLTISLIVPLISSTASSVDLYLLALFVIIFGLPHGALDWFLGKAIFEPRFKNYWWCAFVPLYLFLMSVVFLSWYIDRAFSLLFFVIISIIHFGVGDMPSSIQSPNDPIFFISDVMSHGLLPIACPLYFQPHRMMQSISVLLELPPDHATLQLIRGPISSGLIFAFLFFSLLSIVGDIKSTLRGQNDAKQLFVSKTAELIVLPLLFCRSRTSHLSFGIYFCLWHSIRHILLLATLFEEETFQKRNILEHSKRVVKRSVPVTVATVALGYLLYSLQPYCTQLTVDENVDEGAMARVMFIGLNALTLPHMLVTEIYQRMPSSHKLFAFDFLFTRAELTIRRKNTLSAGLEYSLVTTVEYPVTTLYFSDNRPMCSILKSHQMHQPRLIILLLFVAVIFSQYVQVITRQSCAGWMLSASFYPINPSFCYPETDNGLYFLWSSNSSSASVTKWTFNTSDCSGPSINQSRWGLGCSNGIEVTIESQPTQYDGVLQIFCESKACVNVFRIIATLSQYCSVYDDTNPLMGVARMSLQQTEGQQDAYITRYSCPTTDCRSCTNSSVWRVGQMYQVTNTFFYYVGVNYAGSGSQSRGCTYGVVDYDTYGKPSIYFNGLNPIKMYDNLQIGNGTYKYQPPYLPPWTYGPLPLNLSGVSTGGGFSNTAGRSPFIFLQSTSTISTHLLLTAGYYNFTLQAAGRSFQGDQGANIALSFLGSSLSWSIYSNSSSPWIDHSFPFTLNQLTFVNISISSMYSDDETILIDQTALQHTHFVSTTGSLLNPDFEDGPTSGYYPSFDYPCWEVSCHYIEQRVTLRPYTAYRFQFMYASRTDGGPPLFYDGRWNGTAGRISVNDDSNRDVVSIKTTQGNPWTSAVAYWPSTNETLYRVGVWSDPYMCQVGSDVSDHSIFLDSFLITEFAPLSVVSPLSIPITLPFNSTVILTGTGFDSSMPMNCNIDDIRLHCQVVRVQGTNLYIRLYAGQTCFGCNLVRPGETYHGNITSLNRVTPFTLTYDVLNAAANISENATIYISGTIDDFHIDYTGFGNNITLINCSAAILNGNVSIRVANVTSLRNITSTGLTVSVDQIRDCQIDVSHCYPSLITSSLCIVSYAPCNQQQIDQLFNGNTKLTVLDAKNVLDAGLIDSANLTTVKLISAVISAVVRTSPIFEYTSKNVSISVMTYNLTGESIYNSIVHENVSVSLPVSAFSSQDTVDWLESTCTMEVVSKWMSQMPDSTSTFRWASSKLFRLVTNGWSTDGCRLITVDDAAICQTNHLTNFSIGARPNQIPSERVADRSTIPPFIIIIICCVAAAVIIITIIIGIIIYRRKVSIRQFEVEKNEMEEKVEWMEKISNDDGVQVWKAMHQGTTIVAVKKFERNVRKLVQEATTMRSIHHPNIVLYLGQNLSEKWLMMEWMNEKSLFPYSLSHSVSPLTFIIIRDVVRAMVYVSEQGIVHTLLTPHHQIVEGTVTAKVSNFSRCVPDGTRCSETSGHTAPEVVKYGVQYTSADVWSFGLLLSFIASDGKSLECQCFSSSIDKTLRNMSVWVDGDDSTHFFWLHIAVIPVIKNPTLLSLYDLNCAKLQSLLDEFAR